MKILLANPRGFCAGVERAIEIVDRALALHGPPVYVKHEVVHNRTVVQQLTGKGARFIEDLADVPDNTPVIFSAHGVSREVRREAEARGLTVLDATCPLVTKVHFEVMRHAREARDCILIGHAGHPEVEGTLGQYDVSAGGAIYLVESEADAQTVAVGNPERLAYVTQTTLSLDDTRRIIETLEKRFPAIDGPKRDDICYATQNRQDAVRELSADCDLVLVVGSTNSSNSNRLREVAERGGVPAHLVDSAGEIDPAWLTDEMTVGVTAGASVPEFLVREVVEFLVGLGAAPPEEAEGRPEAVSFSLPRELRFVE